MPKVFRSAFSLFLVLLMLAVSFRFAVFRSYIQSQKKIFRLEVLKADPCLAREISMPLSQLFKDGNGFEWKEDNKELVIKGVYHEVVEISRHFNLAVVSIIEDKLENSLFGQFYSGEQDARDGLLSLGAMIFGLQFFERTAILLPAPVSQPAVPFKHPSDHCRDGFPHSVDLPPDPALT